LAGSPQVEMFIEYPSENPFDKKTVERPAADV
jgi:hypothetical protein